MSALVLVASALATPSAARAADAAPRHLIYLHGRIVQEQQSARPHHPEFGYYELEVILAAFRARGFVVSGEIRPKSATVERAADNVVAQVRQILLSGVPADRITVVGGSMGAGIALLASARLQNPELRLCVLGACLTENVRALIADEGAAPSGRVLAIREWNDDLVGPCTPWNADADSAPGLDARELVLNTGLSHGFLYRPLPEWLNPVVEWATVNHPFSVAPTESSAITEAPTQSDDQNRAIRVLETLRLPLRLGSLEKDWCGGTSGVIADSVGTRLEFSWNAMRLYPYADETPFPRLRPIRIETRSCEANAGIALEVGSHAEELMINALRACVDRVVPRAAQAERLVVGRDTEEHQLASVLGIVRALERQRAEELGVGDSVRSR